MNCQRRRQRDKQTNTQSETPTPAHTQILTAHTHTHTQLLCWKSAESPQLQLRMLYGPLWVFEMFVKNILWLPSDTNLEAQWQPRPLPPPSPLF